MTLNAALQSDERQKYLIEGSRITLFLLILMVSLLSYLLQPAFINWAVLAPFYGLVAAALGIHLFIVGSLDRLFSSPKVLFGTFVLDALLLSLLIAFSGMNQSLFLFLHLVNILLAGLVFRTQGALAVALVTGLFFTGAVLLGPDMKAFSFILLLALNNISFFIVAGLSGYLADQLDAVGSELRRTGLSLAAARELNRLVVENIPQGLLSFEPSGEIVQSNPASDAIFGRGTLIGKNVFELVKGFEPREVGPSARVDVKYLPPGTEDAKLLSVLSAGFQSAELGSHIRMALVEDLTNVRKLEWGLRQAEKMAAVGQLAAGIAHEIRNPLAGISGSVELLSQTATNEDDRKLMKIILREIDRLNHLITEFLEFSRPEEPPSDPVDLVQILQEVLDNVGTAKGIRQDLQRVRVLPMKAMILGRSEKLKQAFLNIIINAAQAAENTLHPLIEVKAEDTQGQIHVYIRDNGSGMTEATKKRMFEPFHTTKPKGTGLGLAVTHKILEGHAAQIFVESEVGVGTEFHLVFPKYHGAN